MIYIIYDLLYIIYNIYHIYKIIFMCVYIYISQESKMVPFYWVLHLSVTQFPHL